VVSPRLAEGGERLEQLRAAADGAEDGLVDFYRARVGKLSQWHARGQAVLPLLTGLLD
jgi:hypothetical protein